MLRQVKCGEVDPAVEELLSRLTSRKRPQKRPPSESSRGAASGQLAVQGRPTAYGIRPRPAARTVAAKVGDDQIACAGRRYRTGHAIVARAIASECHRKKEGLGPF
ncbi:hypothetical protein BHE74_00024594 [Ensete ventricosum]|nr:hypothetical protein BHE74_00024594 [Ensete ventricosum]